MNHHWIRNRKSISEEQDKKKQQVAILDTQLEDSKEKIDQLTSQQHEMEQFYNKRIEVLLKQELLEYRIFQRRRVVIMMILWVFQWSELTVKVRNNELKYRIRSWLIRIKVSIFFHWTLWIELTAEIKSLENQKNDLAIQELSSQRSLQEDEQTLESKEQQIAALEEEIVDFRM